MNPTTDEKQKNDPTVDNTENNNFADLQILSMVSIRGNETMIYICYFRSIEYVNQKRDCSCNIV